MGKYLLGVVGLVILAGGFFYWTSGMRGEKRPEPVGSKKGGVVEEPTGGVIEEAREATMVGETEETSLEAVGKYLGEGVATRSYGEGKFVHAVTASLSDPAEGKFYEGWLVEKTPELRFISTGKLEKTGGEYSLAYESKEDLREYVEVVVTEETESLGLDNQPEEHVLEGMF